MTAGIAIDGTSCRVRRFSQERRGDPEIIDRGLT
jgi:hypothetical protein